MDGSRIFKRRLAKRMPASSDAVRPVALDRLPDLLQSLLPYLPPARASWIVTQLTHRVEQGLSERIRPYELCEGDQFRLGAIVLEQPAGTAMLLAVHGPWMQQPDFGLRCQPLLQRIQQQLAASQIGFLQICADEAADAERLRQLGFHSIAELALMVLELDEPLRADEPPSLPEWSPEEPPLSFLPVADDSQLVSRLCRIAEESFESTLDCPRLGRFRTPQQITAGFCLADHAAPELWRLVRVGEEDAGCLFLTPHRQRDHVDEDRKDGIVAIELTYMALLPSFRRRGMAQAVLRHAVRIAKEVGAERIVLAVDHENTPARKLYERCGWVEVAREWVLGNKISP